MTHGQGFGIEENCLDNCHICKNTHCQVAINLEKIRGEMYKVSGSVNAQLATGTQIMKSLKASIDANMNRVEKVLEKYEVRQKEQEERIAKLEKKVWYASGATGAVSFLLGIFWKYLPFLHKS